MKPPVKSFCFAFIFALSSRIAEARFITSMLTTTNQTNQITIEAYETLKVVTFFDYAGPQSRIVVIKDEAVIRGGPAYYGCSSGGNTVSPCQIYPSSLGPLPFVVTGPATISFESLSASRAGTAASVLTVEITPEAYPPDRSITLAPDTGGAEVTLESSTNLMNWITATNGIYSNLSDDQFLRIKAKRSP